MFITGNDRCPVRSFIKYVRRLNPLCPAFFQQPRKEPIEGIYFDNVKLGHNKLGAFMSEISVASELSVRYTNHSCRATTVHVLDVAQIPSRHIMTVTGHRSESSLKTYSGKTDKATKKLMSEKISEKTKGKSATVTNDLDNIDIGTLQPLTNSQSEEVVRDLVMEGFTNDHDDFDNLLMSIPANPNDQVNFDNQLMSIPANPTNNYSVSNSSQVNVNRKSLNQLPMPIMYNCQNITINYNVS